MEKKCCQISVFESDAGYRVEVRGDKAAMKAHVAGCCGRSIPTAEGCCSGPIELKCDCGKVTLQEVAEGFDISAEGDKATLHGWLKRAAAACCGNNGCCADSSCCTK